jgi:hypothetical protein
VVASEKVIEEQVVSNEHDRTKVSPVEKPIQTASPVSPRVAVRLVPSESLIEEQFVSSDHDRVKVSFVEDSVPHAASSVSPRVAVRLIPTEREIRAEAVADGHNRTRVSSVAAPPRLKLKSGPEPKTFQATPSTLKIMTATRVDSPPQPKKPE